MTLQRDCSARVHRAVARTRSPSYLYGGVTNPVVQISSHVPGKRGGWVLACAGGAAGAKVHAQAPAAVNVERVDDGFGVRVEPQDDLEVAGLGHKRHRVRRADHGDGVPRGLLDGGLQLLEFGPRARGVEAVQEEVHVAVGPFGVGPRPRRAKPAPEPAHLGARTLVAQAQVLEDEEP